MSALIGLHNHTLASDGFLSPETLIQRAVELGYETLAITDHNTIHGWWGLNLPAQVIGGIEMSGICPETDIEVHLLGYGLQPTDEFLAYSQSFYDFYSLTWQTAFAKFGLLPETLDQRSLALGELQQRGVAPAAVLSEWLKQLTDYRLRGKAPAYLSTTEAIALLHRSGATVSIAHPQRYPQAMREALIQSVEALEVYHPHHSPTIASQWRTVAVNFDKKVTGGHDFHGWQEPYDLLPPLVVNDMLLYSA